MSTSTEEGTLLVKDIWKGLCSALAMDDFTTRTYGTSGMDNRPLFGETSARVTQFIFTLIHFSCFPVAQW